MKKEVAKIILINDNKVLLHLRDNKEYLPSANMWSLLGGIIDEGEKPEETIIREIKEEIGIEIKNPTLIKVQNRKEVDLDVTDYIFKDVISCELSELTLTEGQKIEYFDYETALPLNISPHFKKHILNILKDLIVSK